MKKRFLSVFLCAAMSVGMFGGMSHEVKGKKM